MIVIEHTLLIMPPTCLSPLVASRTMKFPYAYLYHRPNQLLQAVTVIFRFFDHHRWAIPLRRVISLLTPLTTPGDMANLHIRGIYEVATDPAKNVGRAATQPKGTNLIRRMLGWIQAKVRPLSCLMLVTHLLCADIAYLPLDHPKTSVHLYMAPT